MIPVVEQDENIDSISSFLMQKQKRKQSTNSQLTDFSKHNGTDFSFPHANNSKFSLEEATSALSLIDSGDTGLVFQSENIQKIMLGLALVHG